MDFGPNISLGYTYEFSGSAPAKQKQKQKTKAEEDDEDVPFHPDVGAKIQFTSLDYIQTFTAEKKVGRKKGVFRPVTGNSNIKQVATAFTLNSNMTSWLSAKATETFYSYNKDPEQFLSTLDSARGLASVTTGMSSTVTGLPQSETLAELTFNFPADWTLIVSESISRSIIDGSNSFTTKMLVTKDLGESWTVGLGWENDKSPLIKDNLIRIDIKYTF